MCSLFNKYRTINGSFSPTLSWQRCDLGMNSCDLLQSPCVDYESRVRCVYFLTSSGGLGSDRPGVHPNESADTMCHLRSLALQVRPGWPMPGLRHRCYVADRPAQGRPLPTEAQVPPQFRPAERQVSPRLRCSRKNKNQFRAI